MKVLTTGGRMFCDGEFVFRRLNDIHRERYIELIIHGGAQGADNRADQWAKMRSIPCLRIPAHHHTNIHQAASIRNDTMIHHWRPDLVVAFPGEAMTRDLVALAVDVGIEVIEAIPA